jgi:LmbE family N-acetylglucosaminyl deacetylase
VLAVVAHPDDESFGLGALLAGFAERGAATSVLCFTHGEASTLHGVPGDLAVVRAGELRAAADALGVGDVTLLDYPDGGLAATPAADLANQVAAAAEQTGAVGLLVLDPSGVTGHADHQQATRAALHALPVLGATPPGGRQRSVDGCRQSRPCETYAPGVAVSRSLTVDEATLRDEEDRTMMYDGWGGGWAWMMLMPLLWIALLAVIVWAVIRLAQPGGRTGPADHGQPRRETPQEILDRRFASGEIDADDYTRVRDTLAGKQPRPS